MHTWQPCFFQICLLSSIVVHSSHFCHCIYFFFCFPLTVNLATSPVTRLPHRVLTLGFIQICSLQAWKVVMRAKKNSLALSLTTRLVFLMKPNENSIFFCLVIPSHPPSLPHSSNPPFASSGAFKLMTNFFVPVRAGFKLCQGLKRFRCDTTVKPFSF